MSCRQHRDIGCNVCGHVMRQVLSPYGDYPPCVECGSDKVYVDWTGGQAPSNDLFGSPQYSDATGEWHTSQHEKIQKMKEWGYYEAGDPVGGARKDHTLKHTTISAPGLGTRTSTGEREMASR